MGHSRWSQKISVNLRIDAVLTKKCIKWPQEASEFPSRKRYCGWPNKSTMEMIALEGCHVVHVAHPHSRDPVDPTQWRLSFSKAEIVLVHTWTNEQKLIYHMLRYFWKHCNLSGVDLISTYHLKTLMFWNCEEHSSDYWDSTRLMHIISDLILWLLQCLGCRRLSNYFIPDCNLLDHELDMNDPQKSRFAVLVLNLLPYTKVEKLVDWFLRNYLFVALEEYPVFSLSQVARNAPYSVTDFDTYATRIDNILDKFVCDFDKQYQRLMHIQMCIFMSIPLWDCFKHDHQSCKRALQMLPEVDVRFIDYFRSFVLLNVANEIQMNEPLPCHWLIDIMVQVTIQREILHSEFMEVEGIEENADSYFRKALCLLKIHAKCNELDVKDLIFLLSKCCFEKSIQCSDSSAVFCAAILCLFVVHWDRDEGQKSIELCNMFPLGRDHSLCGRYRTECRLLQSLGFSNKFFLSASEKWSLVNRDAAVCHDPNIFDCVLLKEYLKLRLKETPKKIMAYSRVDFCELVSPDPTISSCVRRTESLNINSTQGPKKIVAYSRVDFCDIPLEKTPFAEVESSNDSVKQILFNSLLQMSAQYLTVFNEALQQDEEISKYCTVTQQYMAIHHFGCGNFDLALEKCENIIQYWEQNLTKQKPLDAIFHVLCSSPFTLLLDETLKASVPTCNEPQPLLIDSLAVALYIKTECWLRLGLPFKAEFVMMVIRLYLYEKDTQSEPWNLSKEILNTQRLKILQIHRHTMKEEDGHIYVYKSTD